MVGSAWPLFAPLIGALGAFIAGSNTVSNMMFSLFQFSAAEQIGLGAAGTLVVVTLQAVGGAAGNMICVHNVVAASALGDMTPEQVDAAVAAGDACRIEHVISDETFEALKKHAGME